MEKIPMTQEDRECFKNGVRTLCGIEVIQAGAVFARILRAFKKMDFKEVQRVLTGGKSK